jgi:hypothetical protein
MGHGVETFVERQTNICIKRWNCEFNSSSVYSVLGIIGHSYVAVWFE